MTDETTTPQPVDANGNPILPPSAPTLIPPVFIVQPYPASNVFNTLEDANAELLKQAAANPGVEYAIMESRRTGEAPAPAVVTEEVAIA